jgi:glycyl-tRNA synthetase beta chain
VADKRIQNILGGQQPHPSTAVDPSLFETPSERTLWDQFSTLSPLIEESLDHSEYQKALRLMASLREVVDQFFEDVMVLVDDPTLRSNRLALLNCLAETFRRVADISQIVRPGESGAADNVPAGEEQERNDDDH